MVPWIRRREGFAHGDDRSSGYDRIEAAKPRTALRRVIAWLGRAPIGNPVDRRNAVVLQVLLLMLATLPPLMWIYRAAWVDVPWRPGEPVAAALSLALSALAVFDCWLIRRGRFRAAVYLLLAALATAVVLVHLGSGFAANRFEQPVQAAWLVLAGLMMGRRALWLMYAATSCTAPMPGCRPRSPNASACRNG